jgi:hypothetical protein
MRSSLTVHLKKSENDMMRKFFAALCVAGAVLALANPAAAAQKSFTGCPIKSWATWTPNENVSISWAFSGLGPVVAFHPGVIIMGGGIDPLTQAQAAAYSPTLEELRMAAQARKQVTIYWDDSTQIVSTFIVNWAMPC